MVEYGLKVEKAIAGRAKVFVTGYANGSIGYVVTAQAFEAWDMNPKTRP